MSRTVAFFSYTHSDDEASQGLLSKIRETLEHRVRFYLGEPVEIFQDVDSIKTGDDWERKLESALATAAYLIPILTPSLFRSDFCRREIQWFFDREDQLGRGEIVLPVYFASIRHYSKSAPDKLVARCAARQHLDWVKPEFRRKRVIDDDLYAEIDKFAEEIEKKVRAADAFAGEPIGARAVPADVEEAGAKLNSSTAADAPAVDTDKTKPSPATATKEKPFVNSLGMKFVPVPITGGPTYGQRVLFSLWETRVLDYAAYAKENHGANGEWKNVEYLGEKQGPTHPVVNVSWEDAKLFCTWLTKKERAAGLLDSQHEYRLPTDHEWSCAVGIGGKEEANTSPSEKNGKVQDFPWDASGKQWPPPPKAGNYPGFETGKFGWFTLIGYQDPYVFTAPVGSFNENDLGLFDLSGNVWEWCEDWYDNNQNSRVLRGGAWVVGYPKIHLRSSDRNNETPGNRNDKNGFRCVVVRSSTLRDVDAIVSLPITGGPTDETGCAVEREAGEKSADASKREEGQTARGASPAEKEPPVAPQHRVPAA